MLQLIWDHQIEYLRETVYLRIFKSLTETASTFLLQVGLILAWVLIPEELDSIILISRARPEMAWTRWWVQSQTIGRQQHRPGPHRLTLWNKTIHFLFCEAWEELLAAVLFGNASAELGHGEGFQRQQMQFYSNIHAHVHSRSLWKMIACPWWQWYWEPMKEHLDVLRKGNYAWKCPL